MGQKRVVVAGLALATAVAAALRLPFLGAESWWFDETYTVGVVRAGSLGELWERIGASESTPPLFYLLTWLVGKLAGSDGEATLRTVSALATIAAVPVAYAALRRLIGWRAALGAAAIVAVSPVLTSGYALDARAYGLLVLVSLLSVWALAALLERPRPVAFALWALAAAAVIWTHWFGGFLVLGEAVALLWLAPAARRATVLACAGVGAALLPLLGLLREQTGDERAGFIGAYTIPDRLEQLARQFAMGANVPRTWLEAAGLALFAAGVAVGAVVALRRTRSGEEAVGARALLTVLAVGLLVPLLLAVLDLYDRFSIRNVLFLLPLAAGLAALGLERLQALPLAAYLLLCVTAVMWVRADWRYQRTDWGAALAPAAAAARAGDAAPVIAVSPLGQPVAALYLGRAASGLPLATRRAIVVVEPARPPHDRALAPAGPTAAEQQLDAAFPQREERIVHGFRVVVYDAPAPVALDPATLGGGLYPPPVR